ncbi:hypothetical protein [Chitinilyticum litopenaei]|uniref:hypothetical protein n=1 Tax=Chitinilyticum litopenaei TaxID=1121276 RepID=UPI00118547ED|nr:hypothetical protein [Chitinilyticum litopenaei]
MVSINDFEMSDAELAAYEQEHPASRYAGLSRATVMAFEAGERIMSMVRQRVAAAATAISRVFSRSGNSRSVAPKTRATGRNAAKKAASGGGGDPDPEPYRTPDLPRLSNVLLLASIASIRTLEAAQ